MIKTLLQTAVLAVTVAGFVAHENPVLAPQMEATLSGVSQSLEESLTSGVTSAVQIANRISIAHSKAQGRGQARTQADSKSNPLVMSSGVVPSGTVSGLPAGIQQNAQVCEIVSQYPKVATDQLSFKTGVVSRICQPFVQYRRSDLDRCGDSHADPYLSKFTWPSRAEMARRGKANIYTDVAFQAQLPRLMNRAEELRNRATELCCAPGDTQCRKGMSEVAFNICKPKSDPNQPDPCVFGGTYRMPGSGYDSIFRAISRQRGSGAASELRAIAEQNLGASRRLASLSGSSAGPQSGSITLTSYVSADGGAQAMEPVILHELGHACSMVKMQNASLDGSTPEAMTKALRATKWLDSAKRRCDPNYRIPDAVDDFWESIGETKELSSCLKDLTVLNQKQQIDKPCNGLCAGHYIEESVGIAFSLLLGNLNGGVDGVFPNTCDHVRDGQHPMVSDVAECLMQHSPRFRTRMKQAYGCNAVALNGPHTSNR